MKSVAAPGERTPNVAIMVCFLAIGLQFGGNMELFEL